MPEREIRHRCIQTQGGASCETVNSFISTFSPPAAGHRWGIIRFLSPQFKVKPLPVVTTERRLHPYVLTAILQLLPPKTVRNENTVPADADGHVLPASAANSLSWHGWAVRAKFSQTLLTLAFATALLKTESQAWAWAVSSDVLHELGFHLALSRRRTRGVFGVNLRFISIKSHHISQMGKLSAKKRNKERNYLECFWLWGLEREGKQDNTVCLTTSDRHQNHKEEKRQPHCQIQHCSCSECVLKRECLETNTTNLTL